MFSVYGPNEYEEKLNVRKNELSIRFADEGKKLALRILDTTIDQPDSASVSLPIFSSANRDDVVEAATSLLRESGWRVVIQKPWYDGLMNFCFRYRAVVGRLKVSSASGQRQFTVVLLDR